MFLQYRQALIPGFFGFLCKLRIQPASALGHRLAWFDGVAFRNTLVFTNDFSSWLAC
jgi:hypothetical protein